MSIYHWVSVSIMAELTGKPENKIRKTYRTVIENECIPLSEVPIDIQNRYLSEYLLRDRLIDFPFLSAIKDYSKAPPLKNPDIQSLFKEMNMIKDCML